STGPLAKVSIRIFGPCRSARMPTSRPAAAEAARTALARARWSSGWPCERLRRTTSTPSAISFSSMPGASLAGPSVATILVRRIGGWVVMREPGARFRVEGPGSVVRIRRGCKSKVEHLGKATAGFAQARVGHWQPGRDVGRADLVIVGIEAGFGRDPAGLLGPLCVGI